MTLAREWPARSSRVGRRSYRGPPKARDDGRHRGAGAWLWPGGSATRSRDRPSRRSWPGHAHCRWAPCRLRVPTGITTFISGCVGDEASDRDREPASPGVCQPAGSSPAAVRPAVIRASEASADLGAELGAGSKADLEVDRSQADRACGAGLRRLFTPLRRGRVDPKFAPSRQTPFGRRRARGRRAPRRSGSPGCSGAPP